MNKTDNILYHYTDIGAISSIFQAEGILLRMTNTNCLNDKEELIKGYNLLHKFYPKGRLTDSDKSELHNEYVVSLSKAKDCLPMWTTYGKNGQGIAIGFKCEELKKWLEENFYPHGECFYNPKFFRSKLDEVIPKYFYKEMEGKNCFDKDGYAQISHDSLVCLLLKNSAFEYEEEFRVAKFIYPYESGKYGMPEIKFRERAGVLVPYIEVLLPYTLMDCIMLGPTNNSEINKITIDLLLKCRGLGKVKIKMSSIPYRG